MENHKNWRLSWVSYVKTFLFLPIGTLIISLVVMVILGIGMSIISGFLDTETMKTLEALPTRLGVSDNWLTAYIGLSVWAIVTIFCGILAFLNMRSVKLYYDEDGVWLYSGIFPWNKGSNGIKWRDLDTALYTTGFTSWALRSYRIILSHRFTKDAEIILKDIKNGDVFVKEVNELHRQYAEQNRIEG